MKNPAILILAFAGLVGLPSPSWAQLAPADLLGAWRATTDTGEVVRIMADGFFSETHFNRATKDFQKTAGGSWRLANNVLEQEMEFNTKDPSIVGTVSRQSVKAQGESLFIGDGNQEWKKIDSMDPGKLAGAWLFAGRERDGVLSRREPGPRKTMKILSGTRFQWIAYNNETKEFMGTGGGTYTTTNGKYTENIEFFSRDSARVGAILVFDFEIQDSEWHHRGLSSKGDPIYEIWAPREQ